ncbi:hypothetical protein [Pseudonocardia sp. N23]|uniref:hypothetical protein n=1 Tax=Pseudonocardia sp. N23 TaxID=1987376 RepID=UPI000C03421E|nr:hypothetical protein [Pseudonocardia sp. N23]GAY12869.1 hypothetical protein TOK_1419 [Pseudonocardia sp. N23]
MILVRVLVVLGDLVVVGAALVVVVVVGGDGDDTTAAGETGAIARDTTSPNATGFGGVVSVGAPGGCPSRIPAVSGVPPATASPPLGSGTSEVSWCATRLTATTPM